MTNESIPFFAIGNDELEEKKKVGKMAKCPNCGKKHHIKFCERVVEDGSLETTTDLGFIVCDQKDYLVVVKGKSLN